jgi:hypothetical protein
MNSFVIAAGEQSDDSAAELKLTRGERGNHATGAARESREGAERHRVMLVARESLINEVIHIVLDIIEFLTGRDVRGSTEREGAALDESISTVASFSRELETLSTWNAHDLVVGNALLRRVAQTAS